MQPPRVPLQTLSSNTISPTQQQNASITQPSQSQKPIANNHRGRASAPLDPKKQLKLVAPEVLEEFKMEIVGKNRTKIAMIEDLKERYVFSNSSPSTHIHTLPSLCSGHVG